MPRQMQRRQLPAEDRFQKWSSHGVASMFAVLEHHRKSVEHH